MEYQRLMGVVRKAIDEYNLIDEGDKIAVGMSGGKDSQTLLYALSGLQRYYPKKYDLCAVMVDLGFDGFDTSSAESLCKKLDVPLYIVHTDIGQIVFEARHEHNPCSLCANLRKGALNRKVKEIGFNKVAYAHHKDDVVETMLMSLIYEGRFGCFDPKTYLDRSGVTVIRPMLYLDEKDVIGFVHKSGIVPVKNPCPADGNTRRQYIKELLNTLNKKDPGVRERMFSAIKGGFENWKV